MEQSVWWTSELSARPITVIQWLETHLQTFSHVIVKLSSYTFCLIFSVSSAKDVKELKSVPTDTHLFPFFLLCTQSAFHCTSFVPPKITYLGHPQFSYLLHLRNNWEAWACRPCQVPLRSSTPRTFFRSLSHSNFPQGMCLMAPVMIV